MLGSKNQGIKKPLNNQNIKGNQGKAALPVQNDSKMLEKLFQLFDGLNFDVVRLAVTQENPVEQLIVSIGEKTPDDDEQSLKKDYLRDHTVIKLMYLNDFVNVIDSNTDPQRKENYYILQFYSGLPIRFKLEKFWKLQQLLLALSEYLPIGSLCINKNKDIYYRYNLITEKKEISFENTVDIVQIIDFFMRRFRRKITEFVEGRELINNILDDLEKGKFVDW
jgi:hypothetical protein